MILLFFFSIKISQEFHTQLNEEPKIKQDLLHACFSIENFNFKQLGHYCECFTRNGFLSATW